MKSLYFRIEDFSEIFAHSDHNWIQSLFHEHIDHNCMFSFMNSCNISFQSNILCEIFATLIKIFYHIY